MSERRFDLVSIQRADDGPRQAALRITCARCGAHTTITNATSFQMMPPVMARTPTKNETADVRKMAKVAA